MKRVIIICSFFCLFLSVLANSQSLQGLKYHTSKQIDSYDYANTLNVIATHARIVGLGECTHGTAECTGLRKKIVQLLVTQHNYKHFILEGGIAQCEPLNAYITEGIGRPDVTLLIHSPWPFAIKELLDVVEWLKEYNKGKTPEQQVKFYGMDVEYALLKQVRREYSMNGYSILQIDTTLLGELEQINTDTKTRDNLFKKLLEDNALNTDPHDSLLKANMIRTYICYAIQGGPLRKYREELMFDNTSYIINKMPAEEKAMIWSHNNHLSRKYSGRESLGEMLYKEYGADYKVIATAFEGGTFRAMTMSDKSYAMHIYEPEYYAETIEDKTKDINPGIVGFSIQDNAEHPLVKDKQKTKTIGAEYNEVSAKKDDFYTEKLKLINSFDYLFVIKKSTPTTMLGKQK